VAAEHEMRVSDAEREAAAAELREHFASGRLDSGDLDQRLTAVFAARTRGDLSALFTDLPSAGHGWSGPLPAGGRSFGPAPFGAGPFGARAADWGQWTPPGGDAGGQDRARGGDWRASAGRTVGRVVTTSVLMVAVFTVGVLGIFGIGAGRPFGIILLVFILIGRGRRGRGGRRGGPRRRR
jgi:hypothetical protein